MKLKREAIKDDKIRGELPVDFIYSHQDRPSLREANWEQTEPCCSGPNTPVMFSDNFIASSFMVPYYAFHIKFSSSIIQMPKNYYTFPYTVKIRFTGMF